MDSRKQWSSNEELKLFVKAVSQYLVSLTVNVFQKVKSEN